MVLGKMSIHKRILLMLLSVVFFVFFALGLVALWESWGMWKNTQEISRYFDAKVTSFAEERAITQTRKQMGENAKEKASQVERALNMLREDTEYLADAVQRILAHPEWYPARRLPTPFEKRLSSGEAYLLVTPKVSKDCSSEAALRDIALLSNIVDDLEVMSHFYEDSHSSCFLGSKYGYLINADVFSSDEEYQRLHSEEFHTIFDPRERPWYQVAAAGGKTAFTDVYVGNDGSPELTCAAPYYDADGLAGVVGIDVHLPLLYDLVADKSLGSTNVNFALNSKGEILFSTETEGTLAVGDGHRELDKSTEESLALAAAGMKAGLSDIVLVTMDGEEYYLAYVPLPSLGYSFGTMLKREEALAPVALARESLSAHADAFHSSMRSLFLGNTVKTFLLALVLFGLFFYGSRRMAKQFVQPILTLTEAVREIAKGNLDRKTDIRTGDEIEELSDSVNHMTGELKEYMENLAKVTMDKQKIATELSLAQGIQEDMLPSIFPKFSNNPHYDLFATMHAAKEVGGDFYDFYDIDETHVVLTLADVSGKGIPASLFMVISKTMLKNDALAATMEQDPELVDWAGIMERVNRQLCENNEEMMFVTVFFGVLNIVTGEFIYVNGGHNAPLIGRVSEGKTDWEYIRDEKKTHMVGVIENAKYMQKRLTLKQGDMLYFYTDGVTEAMDGDGHIYTEERLQEALFRAATPEIKMADMLARIREDIDAHANGAEQSDDITMLGVRFLG